MTPMYYSMNKLAWLEQSESTNIFDEEYHENQGRLNRRLIISSIDDNIADTIPSVSCSVDTVPTKDMSPITLKNCEEYIVSSTSCDDDDDDDDENVSYDDSSYGEAIEQLDYRRLAATEARDDDSYDDDSDDDDCIVFRRIEPNILSYPRPRTSICRQSLDCTSTDSDENDSVTDLWTLKRAHPISEDDDDSSPACNFYGDDDDDDEEPTSSKIGSNVFDESNAASLFVSFNENNGISVLNPRKRQKYEDVL